MCLQRPADVCMDVKAALEGWDAEKEELTWTTRLFTS
jgi:hypothetical protein